MKWLTDESVLNLNFSQDYGKPPTHNEQNLNLRKT